jgi:hypothetical protein
VDFDVGSDRRCGTGYSTFKTLLINPCVGQQARSKSSLSTPLSASPVGSPWLPHSIRNKMLNIIQETRQCGRNRRFIRGTRVNLRPDVVEDRAQLAAYEYIRGGSNIARRASAERRKSNKTFSEGKNRPQSVRRRGLSHDQLTYRQKDARAFGGPFYILCFSRPRSSVKAAQGALCKMF